MSQKQISFDKDGNYEFCNDPNCGLCKWTKENIINPVKIRLHQNFIIDGKKCYFTKYRVGKSKFETFEVIEIAGEKKKNILTCYDGKPEFVYVDRTLAKGRIKD